MKGKQWLRSVEAENLHFDTAIKAISTKQQREEVQRAFHDAAYNSELQFTYQSGSIQITPGGLYSLQWRWAYEVPLGKVHVKEAAAVQCDNNMVWAVEADKEGKEIYMVSCYSMSGRVWHHKTSIAPYICVKNGRCYILEATAELRYGRCVSLDANTGKDRHVLFIEPSLENNLSLIPGENGCIFLQSDNSGTKALYVIEDDTVTRVGHNCVSFVPVGYPNLHSKDVCFFGRINSFDSPWFAFGDNLRFDIPINLRRYGIDLFSLKHRIIVTSAGGMRRIYRVYRNGLPHKLGEIVGTIGYDTYGVWEGRDILRLTYMVPGQTPSVYDLYRSLKPVIKGGVYANYKVEKAKSRDGTDIPYVVVQNGPIRGVMVVIYGAYGIPTSLGTTRWKPYLDAGWAIVFGLIRGSGDFGDAWADAARTYKKWKSIEDTVAVIRDVQKQTGIDWKRTCIYGRSAGGYTLGAVLAHYSEGLVGAAYAEVPYVDVLRTTSTPSLPLTILEYNEFGNPMKNPRDLKTIRELSPVDALPAEGAPGVFVVARTSANDREVLPYETVKWIRRLRGSGEEKYLSITDGHGHFVKGITGDKQKAEDFILLDAWLDAYKKSEV